MYQMARTCDLRPHINGVIRVEHSIHLIFFFFRKIDEDSRVCLVFPRIRNNYSKIECDEGVYIRNVISNRVLKLEMFKSRTSNTNG